MKQSPTDIIRADHKKIEKLFQQFDSSSGEKREELAGKIFDELELHATIEEQIFYPMMDEEGDEEVKKLLEEGYEEHGKVKETIAELREAADDSEDFLEKMDLLKAEVLHHVQEEEAELLPKSEEVLTIDEAEELANEMRALKTEGK